MQGQQREVAQRRSKVEEELAEAGPAVEEARAAVQGIKRQQLDEVYSHAPQLDLAAFSCFQTCLSYTQWSQQVRSMMNPPGGVKTTMEAICVMLFDLKKPAWEEIRKSIRRDDFIPSIIGFNTQVFNALT